jgi:hypothetical protein
VVNQYSTLTIWLLVVAVLVVVQLLAKDMAQLVAAAAL